MKYLLLSLMLLVGCSTDKETVFVAKGTPGSNGSSCTTYPVEGGANVKCGDSITFIANGSKGDSGASGVATNGVDGSDGVSCSVVREESNNRSKITCGESVAYVFDGTDGQSGSSCTVTPATGGANVTCGDSTVFIANGQAGSSVAVVGSATVAQCPTGGVVLTGGITICNGSAGATGPAGTGATVSDLSSDSCTLITGSSPAFYYKNNELYTKKDGSDCKDKVADLQDGEVIFVAPKIMVVKDAETRLLKLVNFN